MFDNALSFSTKKHQQGDYLREAERLTGKKKEEKVFSHGVKFSVLIKG